ncbi:hypothetical protein B1987_28840 [Mycobacterium kansasii]|nr:hypothetical protein B1987_28840 [Mycobacterium kansasii]
MAAVKPALAKALAVPVAVAVRVAAAGPGEPPSMRATGHSAEPAAVGPPEHPAPLRPGLAGPVVAAVVVVRLPPQPRSVAAVAAVVPRFPRTSTEAPAATAASYFIRGVVLLPGAAEEVVGLGLLMMSAAAAAAVAGLTSAAPEAPRYPGVVGPLANPRVPARAVRRSLVWIPQIAPVVTADRVASRAVLAA